MPFQASGNAKSGIFRAQTGAPDGTNKLKHVFMNILLPLNGAKMLKGSVLYVALEVAVSKLLRKISGFQDRSIMELSIVHTMSLPLMGGLSATMTSPAESTVAYGSDRIRQHAKQGLKGVPALFLANYIYNTFLNGFYVGSFSMKNLFIMAAAKMLTRPIASKVYPMAKFTQNAFDGQQFMEEQQVRQSNFSRIAQGDLYKKV